MEPEKESRFFEKVSELGENHLFFLMFGALENLSWVCETAVFFNTDE